MRPEEQAYVDKISRGFPDKGEVSLEVLALVEEAVAAFPQCARLWCLRGDLIQCSPIGANYQLADALSSYQEALVADPLCAEAHESIGYYYDVIEDDPNVAEASFRRAIRLGAGRDSYIGLARVLAELGRREEALEVLAPQNCPLQDEAEIHIIREEIAGGMWSPPESDIG
jgi:tetratricopeptide (TPR) repeat protein